MVTPPSICSQLYNNASPFASVPVDVKVNGVEAGMVYEEAGVVTVGWVLPVVMGEAQEALPPVT